jgi:hypothetical protein
MSTSCRWEIDKTIHLGDILFSPEAYRRDAIRRVSHAVRVFPRLSLGKYGARFPDGHVHCWSHTRLGGNRWGSRSAVQTKLSESGSQFLQGFLYGAHPSLNVFWFVSIFAPDTGDSFATNESPILCMRQLRAVLGSNLRIGPRHLDPAI